VGVLGVDVGPDAGGPALGDRSPGHQGHVALPELVLLEGLLKLLLLPHGGGEKGRGGDDLHLEALGGLDDVVHLHVPAQVVDVEAVGLEHGHGDALADVVDVALDGGDQNVAGRLRGLAPALGQGLGEQIRHRHHDLGRHDELGQEKGPPPEALADLGDARDEAAGYDLQGGAASRYVPLGQLHRPILVGLDDRELGLVENAHGRFPPLPAGAPPGRLPLVRA
jgi:hypothetical protein